MKLADAFQIAKSKRAAVRAVPTLESPSHMPKNSPYGQRTGEPHHNIVWSDAEWLTLLRELMRLYPEMGLPNPNSVGLVRLKHMHASMQVLPVQRRRTLVQLSSTRPRLASYCKLLSDEAAGKRAPVQTTTLASLPPSVIYRQPDGADNGKPPEGSRIFWRESEWYSLALELIYTDASFLDTLNHLLPADLYRAQRVLPTDRRRPQASMHAAKIRAELAPAVRRVRAAIDAKRAEDAQNQAAAETAEAERAEQARQAAEMAAQAAKLDQMAQAPEFTARALGAAAFGPLLDALLSRGAASLQGILENALVNAFSSDRVKQAMVVNLHMNRAEGSAQEFKANPPSVGGSVAAAVVMKPKIGILGALAQQGEVIAASYPQLRIKAIDKNLSGQSLREAILNCDRVISMTSFISHSMDGVAQKALGDRYTRVDGGVSSVRRMIDVWISSGVLQTAVATSEPTDSKGK